MKALRKFLDSQHPHFVDGGKFEKFYPIYEMIDTFVYSPGETAKGSVHVRDALDLKRLMGTVAIALMPCILMACYNTGFQANTVLAEMGQSSVEGWRGAILALIGLATDPANIISNFVHGLLYFLPVFIVTQAAGGACEVLFSVVRKHEINEGFLVTGLLYPLTLPPTIPLWQVAVGIIFGVIVGKEIFGGTGKNFLNPALTARAFLFFAYPAQISGDAVWTAVRWLLWSYYSWSSYCSWYGLCRLHLDTIFSRIDSWKYGRDFGNCLSFRSRLPLCNRDWFLENYALLCNRSAFYDFYFLPYRIRYESNV